MANNHWQPGWQFHLPVVRVVLIKAGAVLAANLLALSSNTAAKLSVSVYLC